MRKTETITVAVEMRIAYEDVPGARDFVIKEAVKSVPFEMSGAHAKFGGYGAKRKATKLAG